MNDYYSDNSDCRTKKGSSMETTPRKRRTPVTFQLRITSDDETTVETARPSSRNGNTDEIFDSDSNSNSNSNSISESKAEESENDFDEYDLLSPTAIAQAATKTDVFNEMLSHEMLKMSLPDRTDIQEEIHGVRCLSIEETPQVLRTALQKFQRDLDSLPDAKKKTYLQILSVVEKEKLRRQQ